MDWWLKQFLNKQPNFNFTTISLNLKTSWRTPKLLDRFKCESKVKTMER
jgi:hypothetical protein